MEKIFFKCSCERQKKIWEILEACNRNIVRTQGSCYVSLKMEFNCFISLGIFPAHTFSSPKKERSINLNTSCWIALNISYLKEKTKNIKKNKIENLNFSELNHLSICLVPSIPLPEDVFCKSWAQFPKRPRKRKFIWIKRNKFWLSALFAYFPENQTCRSGTWNFFGLRLWNKLFSVKLFQKNVETTVAALSI